MKLTNYIQYRTPILEDHLIPLGAAVEQLHMHCIGVSSDGRIAVIADKFLLSVWDVKSDEFLGHLVGHSNSILAIDVQVLKSHDDDAAGFNGEYSCISVSLDGTTRVWDLKPLLKGETFFMRGWTSCLVAYDVPEGKCPAGSWIKNEKGEYLFFIPLHRPFRHPLNTLVIGQCPELDMTHFVYGEEWTKCREPIAGIEKEMKGSVLASESDSGEPGPVAAVII
jgi:WD40 repeat protein